MFSVTFLAICIFGALIMTAGAAITLIGLMIHDLKNEEVW